MCGICGTFLHAIASERERLELPSRVRRMAATLAPRGPDASGLWADAMAALGHRRLSILDLSDAGAQPMQAGRTGPVISYIGEIYNHRELRGRLDRNVAIGWRGHSDTEVALQVYAHWGLHGLKQLEGIFALALWDPAAKRLILMRDRLGIKPLYWGHCTLGLVPPAVSETS